jgi:hypothetical protein
LNPVLCQQRKEEGARKSYNRPIIMQNKEYYGLGRAVVCVDTITLVTASFELAMQVLLQYRRVF